MATSDLNLRKRRSVDVTTEIDKMGVNLISVVTDSASSYATAQYVFVFLINYFYIYIIYININNNFIFF